MSTYSYKDQALALAGVFQAANLVEKVAKTGQAPEDALITSLSSILNTSPNSVADVYEGASGVMLGLRVLRSVLQKEASSMQTDTIRYALTLLHLERKLSKNPAMLTEIGSRLDKIKDQVNHFAVTHENIIAAFASLYQDTISTFRTRIQVTGEMRHLQQQVNADKIRACLLAGIRAAMLWHQTGGSRWQLLLSRSKLLGGVESCIHV